MDQVIDVIVLKRTYDYQGDQISILTLHSNDRKYVSLLKFRCFTNLCITGVNFILLVF